MSRDEMSVVILRIVLALTLIIESVPVGAAVAAGGGSGPVGAHFRPLIGHVESEGALTIDSRTVTSGHPYHTGEVVGAGTSQVRVRLDEIGLVILGAGSLLKIEEVVVRGDATMIRAHLIGGQADFQLQDRCSAVVRVDDRDYIASLGAVFQLESGVKSGRAAVMRGRVQPLGGWGFYPGGADSLVADMAGPASGVVETPAPESPRYRIVPLATARKGPLQAHTISQLQFRVTNRESQPVRGALVAFAIDKQTDLADGSLGSGQISARNLTVITDRDGVATVPFRAGQKAGRVLLTAAVDGVSVEQDQAVEVGGGGFWTKKTALPVFGVMAAVVTAAIIVIANRDDPVPVKGTGPIIIVP